MKWVLPGIVIRVISKRVAGGRLYNKKMRIVDVPDKYSFQAIPIDIDSQSKVYDDLVEKDIETVIPKDNSEEVMILKGDFRRKTGKILSRNKKEDEVII